MHTLGPRTTFRLIRIFPCSSRTLSLAREEKMSEGDTKMRARLLYQSKKRGILENDIILGEFAEKNLTTMNRPLLEQYDKLINGEHMEWDLYYYLSGKKAAPKDMTSSEAFRQLKQYVDSKRNSQH